MEQLLSGIYVKRKHGTYVHQVTTTAVYCFSFNRYLCAYVLSNLHIITTHSSFIKSPSLNITCKECRLNIGVPYFQLTLTLLSMLSPPALALTLTLALFPTPDLTPTPDLALVMQV